MSDPAVATFANEARAYRDLIEGHERLSETDFLKAAYRSLSRILAAYHDLPSDYETSPEDDDFFFELGDLNNQIRGRFTRYYMHFWEPADLDSPDHKEVCGDLADDFCDIAVDLLNGLHALESGQPAAEGDAIFYWRLMYSHWGEHLTGALFALHWILKDEPEFKAY